MNLFVSLLPAIPEMFLLIMSCAILMIGVFSKNGAPSASFWLSTLSLFITTLLVACVYFLLNIPSVIAFHNMFILDKLAVVLKIFILIAMIFTFWYSHLYNENNLIPANEFYVLGL